MVRIALLPAQLQMQSLGKGNLSVGEYETASVPPVSTDSSINPPCTVPAAGQFSQGFWKEMLLACSTGVAHSADRNFQPVLPIKQQAFSGLSSPCYGGGAANASHHKRRQIENPRHGRLHYPQY